LFGYKEVARGTIRLGSKTGLRPGGLILLAQPKGRRGHLKKGGLIIWRIKGFSTGKKGGPI